MRKYEVCVYCRDRCIKRKSVKRSEKAEKRIKKILKKRD
jgi:hypothetical protein